MQYIFAVTALAYFGLSYNAGSLNGSGQSEMEKIGKEKYQKLKT